LKIVAATSDHLDALAELNAEVQAIHVAFDPTRYLEPDLRALRDWFVTALDRPGDTVLVALDDDQVLGYVRAVIKDTPRNPFVFPQRSLYLDQICVREAARGRGIGRSLVSAVFEVARTHGATRVRLDTAYDNQRAQAFFCHLGFRQGHLHWDVRVPASPETDR